ncbi:hypothetical protein [Flagellimonas onchidii]|uniref:hypothetical protein n=1 Tax=Flagellimonas onchidii TaxID=2562684 RepID=UPI0010A65C11|nr:hypothetical protein [Allomuricauda onchidii]
METVTDQQIDTESLKNKLQSHFKDCKVKHPLINKKIIVVTKGASMVRVIPKSEGIKVDSGVNLGNIWIALGFGIGLVFGFIGGFLFYGIVWAVTKKKFKRMEQQVKEYLDLL